MQITGKFYPHSGAQSAGEALRAETY